MKKKLNLLKKKLEFTAMAVTYAEAGEWSIADGFLKKIEALNKSQKPKILVVSLDSEFSEETAEYSVNLAERMKYDLLAVNAIQQEKSKKHLERELNRDSHNAFKRIFGSLLQKASECRVHCETFVTTSNVRTQIEKLLTKIHHIKFVLVQGDHGQKLSLSLDVPAFQIKTAQTCPSPPVR